MVEVEEEEEEEAAMNPFRPWQQEFYDWQDQHGGLPTDDQGESDEGVEEGGGGRSLLDNRGRIALRDSSGDGGCVVLVGDEARRQQAANPGNTYCRVKRLLGRRGTTAAERTGVGPGVSVVSAAAVPAAAAAAAAAADAAAAAAASSSSSPPSSSASFSSSSYVAAATAAAGSGFEAGRVSGVGGETLLSAERKVAGGFISPVDVSAEVVRALLEDVATLWKGPMPTRAVVGIPAHFDAVSESGNQ